MRFLVRAAVAATLLATAAHAEPDMRAENPRLGAAAASGRSAQRMQTIQVPAWDWFLRAQQAEEPRRFRRAHRHARSPKKARAHVARKSSSKAVGFYPKHGGSLVASIRADIGTNPTGWRRQWCGRYYAMKTCRSDPRLNLARNWAKEGTPAPGCPIGSTAVFSNHVGAVTGRCAGGALKIVSGNFGALGVDEGCSHQHLLACRWVQGCGFASTKPDDIAVDNVVTLPEVVVREEKTAQVFPLYKGEHPESVDVAVQPSTPIEPGPPASPSPGFVKTGPLVASLGAVPAPINDEARRAIFERDEVKNYLCEVYNRTPVKRDGTGDFTWKDPFAAAKRGMSVCEYAVGGMSPPLRKALFKIGKKLDERGIKWSMLSAFRDDVRQGLIKSGVRARVGNSLHGGSRVTCGYGCGKAIDVTIVGAGEDGPKRAGDIFAKFGPEFGLRRPYPGFDPAHVQLASAGGKKARRWARHRHHSRYASR